jgi:integrase/recombinase XerD
MRVCASRNDSGNRGASLAKRIMTTAEMALLIRAARSKRDRILIEVAYAGGLRVSEVVNLTWADVLPRENDLVQLSILGKGEKPRQVLLPEIVSRSLLTLRDDTGANDPVFASPKIAKISLLLPEGVECHRLPLDAGVFV